MQVEDFSEQLRQILQARPEGISEYELIKALRAASVRFAEETDLQDTHALFRLHFLLFHYLYRLRDKWLQQKTGCLQINALKIVLLPYSSRQSSEMSLDDEIRRYYLDLSNFDNTSADEVNDMLDNFWKKLLAAEDRVQALDVLELEATADYEQIRERYRVLVMQYHPDRGGDLERLQAINQAMGVLKNYYQ